MRSTDAAERYAALADDPSAPTDPDLAGLAALTRRLRDLPGDPETGPDAGFRADLRARLVAEAVAAVPTPRSAPERPAPIVPAARTSSDPASRPRPARAAATGADGGDPTGTGRAGGWRRRRLGVFAAVAALLVLTGTSVAASRSALPGDALYGIKRSAENVTLSLARDDGSRGRRYLELARVRLDEVRALAGSPDEAARTLADMDAQTAAGVRLATTRAVRDGDESALTGVADWALVQYRTLGTVRAALAEPAATRAGDSLELLRRVALRVATLRAQLDCGCLDAGRADELGPLPCTSCAASRTPPGPSVAPSAGPRPGRTPSGGATATGGGTGPSTAPPRATPGPDGAGPSGQPGASGPGQRAVTGAGNVTPLPLPSGGGSVPLPLPTIPGIPLPSSLPVPVPPLPTGGLPPLLPGG